MKRHEEPCGWEEIEAPPLPEDFDRDELQPISEGTGPRFHRTYSVRIAGSEMSPEQLMDAVTRNLNRVAPDEFASFHKASGGAQMRAGDEYRVRMAGPYDGPVRVIERTPCSFRLATLDKHLEAGQIEFTASRDGDHLLFAIESWARSADRVVHVLYRKLRMAKEIQLHMWTSMLEQTVDLAGGRRAGPVEIRTRRAECPSDG